MSCLFAGIFYVESLFNRQLQCRFKDEDNVIRHLNLIHFQSANTFDHPFSDAFEPVQSDATYFIVEIFAIHNVNNILITAFTV